jgi:hypothetical protein
MMRGGKFVGDKAPHMLFRNGLWRCYTLIWKGAYTIGLRLGLGHTLDAAYNRWLDGEMTDSGATLYTRKL